MFQILAYINYWLRQVDAHSLHSPFLFDLYEKVISADKEKDPEIEALRRSLKSSKEKIEINDLGAGSRISNQKKRRIGSIAHNSATPPHFSVFLKDLIAHYNYQSIWELGTSLGLNTLYMAQNKNAQIKTFEADPTLVQIARENFKKFKLSNIEVIEGDITETLPLCLAQNPQLDLVYIDANHRYQPTLDYYEMLLPHLTKKAVLVFDDIHWSKDMSKAWKEIVNDNSNSLTIDLFEAGLVFIDPELHQSHQVIRF